jgi:hypothetical protein
MPSDQRIAGELPWPLLNCFAAKRTELSIQLSEAPSATLSFSRSEVRNVFTLLWILFASCVASGSVARPKRYAFRMQLL